MLFLHKSLLTLPLMTDGEESINCTFSLSGWLFFNAGARKTEIKMSASVCCTQN